MNVALETTDLLNFMLLRLGLIALGVLVLAAIVITAVVILRRHGRLDQARRYVAPAAEKWAGRGGPVRHKIVDYLAPEDRDKPSR
ncbi:MAG: hypothetical protein ABW215_23675 [Kibdelosporangium sp.]